MTKELKKIISSPLLVIVFAFSLIILLVNFFIYQSSDFDYSQRYNVVYSENIESYYDEINKYDNLIDSMDEKTYGYDYYKKRYTDVIKIYEKLISDNVDYSSVYDFGYGNVNDRSVYLYLSNSFMLLIITINVISIVYLAFTRDFDNSRYAFLYESSRKKLMLRKIISSFLVISVLFIIYCLMNYFFSLRFDAKYQNVLIVSNEANFIKVSKYLAKYVFGHLLYNMIVLFLLFWIAAILVKKTINFIVVVLTLGVLIAVFPFTNYLFTYIGMSQMYDIVPLEAIDFTKLFFFIPIGILVLVVFHFEKRDL